MSEETSVEKGKTISSSLSSFYLMITGLSFSILGASITGFSISLWILDHTKSITLFTLVAAVNTLPAVLLGPIAGAYVDRWNRRKVLLVAESGACLSVVCLAAIYGQGLLGIEYIIIFGVINSLCQAFILPAVAASTIMMVPAAQLARANSARVVSMGLAQLLAPAIAGFLLGAIELKGIFALSIVGFLIAIASIISIRIPQPIKTQNLDKAMESIWAEMNFAWQYLRSQTGLFLLLVFYATVNFSIVSLNVLFLPLMKNFATVKQIGLVVSIGGAGILLGGVATMLFGNVQHKILTTLMMSAVISFSIIFSTIMPSIYSVGIGIFIITASFPVIMSLSQTVWQQKLAPDVQGRIFGFRATVVGVTIPIAYLLSGLLADGFFEPGMQAGGTLAQWFGSLYGVGAGRGLAVMAGMYGLITLLAVILAALHPRIRNLEKELPDCKVVAEGQIEPA
ncbi:MAG TPA: MFS transporter [Pseudomonadales bacterium]